MPSFLGYASLGYPYGSKLRTAPPGRVSLVYFAYGSHIPNTPISEISTIFDPRGHFLPLFFFFSQIPRTFAALISFFMLAVVKIAGQQFKVQKDQTLYVPRIAGNAGDKVEFAEVLLSHGDDKLSVGKEVKAVIKAEIIDHVQGDKVIAFKMKRRKGFRKKHGHRTHYTKIRISEIA
jgi:large subunit ribosomal protein L21